jgi:ribosomal 50S subunit-recycling heat shock protein
MTELLRQPSWGTTGKFIKLGGYGMRIDKYLKVSRLIKRRTLAKEVCDHGNVMVNGKVVKAGYEVSVGEVLELHIPSGTRKVVIEKVLENTPANKAAEMYREV